MNKRFEIVLVVVIFFAVLTLIGLIVGNIFRKNEIKIAKELEANAPEPEEVLVSDDEALYYKVKEFIQNERLEKGYDNKQPEYKVFVYCDKFGITEQGEKKNVYAWILEKSYYVKDNKLKISEGSSLPYKFVIKDGEVVDYKTPRNGIEYAEAIIEMAPSYLQTKILAYTPDETTLDNEIDEYYKYLSRDKIELYNIEDETEEENE